MCAGCHFPSFRAVADRSVLPLLSLFLKSVPVAVGFFPLYRRWIIAWPMVSVSQPSQPRLRDDPDNVRQVFPSRSRTTLDGYQAITSRHAQGDLRQLAADTSAGRDLVKAAVACPFAVEFVANNAQNGEFADRVPTGQGRRHRSRGGEAASALDGAASIRRL